MKEEIFIEKKKKLIDTINKYLLNSEMNVENKFSLKEVLEILNQYSFENRLKKKGLLTHTIIDALQLDYSLGIPFIEFDNDIK